ncbi:MAG: hypothetical protein AAGF85_01330 [Bacteroidota bacterium]
MEKEKHMLPKWLEKTQHNSWEPEIFISGIVLFGLLQIPEYLVKFRYYFQREIYGLTTDIDNFVAVLITGIQWLTFGLILHLFFRGIWIGLVGLSYVFPNGINKADLNYKGKFQTRINNIPDFTNQIIRLEKISSSIFSISYFLFMSILGGYAFFLTTIIGPIYLFFNFSPYSISDLATNPAIQTAANSYAYFVLGLGLIYMLDFLSLGIIKRSRYLSKVYYPLYQIVSFLTFSTLYRNIYYILISNFKKWKVIVFIAFFIVTTFFLASFHADSSSASYQFSQLEFYGTTSGNQLRASAYENFDGTFVGQRASIQSDIVKDDVLRLFVTHLSLLDDSVRTQCNFRELESQYETDSLKIACLSSFYQIKVNDSLYKELEWKFHYHSKSKHRGIITYIDIRGLNRGMHTLNIGLANWYNSTYQEIPFFKE